MEASVVRHVSLEVRRAADERLYWALEGQLVAEQCGENMMLTLKSRTAAVLGGRYLDLLKLWV